MEVVKRVWTETAPFDYEGEFYRLEQVHSQVRTLQKPHVPLYFGGASEAAKEVGASRADVYALWGEPLAAIKEQVADLRDRAASTQSRLNWQRAGVETTHLGPCILGGETPVDGGSGRIALCLVGADVPLQCVLVRIASPETGSGQYAELYLSHIQPVAMLGSVMELQPFGDAPGLSRRKGLVEGSHPMCVQVVEHQPDHRDIGICLVHQPLHLMGEVLHGAPLGNRHMAPASRGSQVRNRFRVPRLRYS